MSKNQDAFQRFAEILDSRQLEYDPDLDIREYVLSLTSKRIGVGFVSQALKTKFAANLPRLFPNITGFDENQFPSSDVFIGSGTIFREPEHSHKGLIPLLTQMPQGAQFLFCEASFLATTHSWSHSFKEGKPEYACLGYVYDDIANYFMSDYPNRIIQKLNSTATLTDQEMERARQLIARIVNKRVSKYNAQPMHAPAMTEGFLQRVLVVDQSYADASTFYGKVDDVAFERMLLAALNENPNAEILVKTHPDSSWEKSKRAGYYSHLVSTGRIRLLRDPVNPYAIFDHVDKVYVGSSQMGLEALFAGKEVICFGAPFYAGWGLTSDRQSIPHRHRTRTLEEVFHYFYVWYTIYHVPGYPVPSTIEDALDYIETNRPFLLPPSELELTKAPKVSIIIPVHGVENYVEECITSIQKQTLRDIEIIPVNDCSPDGSQLIIDRLSLDDPRIRPIILSNNVGQGFARNKGIEAARGEYLWFIDADDWMPNPTFLEKAIKLAEKEDLDMVRGRKKFKQIEDENGNILRLAPEKTESAFNTSIEKTNIENYPNALSSWNFWLWLYRKEFIKDNSIYFELTQMEERPFIVKALLKSQNFGILDEDAVRYRERPTSTMRRQRKALDNERMLENVKLISKQFQEAGAADAGSPLKEHMNIVISQMINAIFWGITYQSLTSLSGEEGKRVFLDSFRNCLLSCDFRMHDICDPSGTHLRDRVWKANAYQLLISALRLGRYEYVEIAANLRPVEQIQYLDALKKAPQDSDEADFQSALNKYARNDMISTTKIDGLNNTRKPRIVIHIGATKTGSTFIQHFLEENRPALMRAGIWFPEVGLFWQPTRPHKQAGHSEFTKSAVKKDQNLREHIESGLAQMDGQIHTIVLSSEAFFLQPNAPLIAKYFPGHPIEMICYIRRQDEWVNAQYCEFVAGGAVGRIDVSVSDWLTDSNTIKLLDYRTPIQKWSREIGKDNVKVRVFENQRFKNGDLLADFADAANLPVLLDLPRPDDRSRNAASLSGAHVEMIRLYNAKPFESRDTYFNFIEECTNAIGSWRKDHKLPSPKPWVLSEKQAAEVMDQAEACNRDIANNFLGEKSGKLFGPASARPDSIVLHKEELDIVAEAYERAKPIQDTSKHKTPKAKLHSVSPGKVHAAKKASTKPDSFGGNRLPGYLVNYGLFGWRYWLLTPLLAVLFARRASPALFRAFLLEPAVFARANWSDRRPFMTCLLYPNGDLMGPFGLLRIWLPVLRWFLKITDRPDLIQRMEESPVVFVRSMKNPLRRIVGRLMFPYGELRR